MQIQRSMWRTLASALGVGVVATLACTEVGPRVYTARLYHVEEACFDYYAPIGLVEADELGALCNVTCLRGGEGQLYVSSVCAPYPATVAVEDPAESPECAQALAVWQGEFPLCDVPEDAGVEDGSPGSTEPEQ